METACINIDEYADFKALWEIDPELVPVMAKCCIALDQWLQEGMPWTEAIRTEELRTYMEISGSTERTYREYWNTFGGK